MTLNHDQLAESLAAHLRANTDSVVWTNMQMGPSGSARPDVYAIAKSYSKFNAAAFEVKVSAADLLRDLSSGKWQSYLKFSTTVCFAMAADLAKSHGDRVPRECGLIVLGETGWRYRRRAINQPLANLPRDAWLKLVIDGVEREAKRPRDRQARTEWMAERALTKAIGEHAARQIELLRTNPDRVVYELNRHAKEMDQLRALHTRVENEQYAKVQAARRMQEGQCSEYLERIARALGCEAQDAVDRLGLVCNLMTGVDWRDPIRKALDGMQAASQALQLVHSLIRGGASIQQDSGTVTAAPAVSTQVVDCGAAAQTRTGDLLITNHREPSPESAQEQALSEEQARAGVVEKGELDQGCGQTLQQPAETLEGWSLRMAALESGQEVRAGSAAQAAGVTHG